MFKRSRSETAGRVGARRAVAGGLAVALAGGLAAVLPATVASAAPQTETIQFDAAAGPQSGTLANQVEWSVDVGVGFDGPIWGLASGGGGQLTTFSFDRPVDLRFGIGGLNGSSEGVQLPEATELEELFGSTSWDPGTHSVTGPDGSGSGLNPSATFTLDNVDVLEVQPFGSGLSRQVSFIEVTYDLPVAAVGGPADGGEVTEGDGSTLDFSCEDGTGEVTGEATVDGEPIDNGARVDTLEPGEHTLEVTCTDENGASHTQTVTFTVLPGCFEDGLQVLEPPHSVFDLSPIPHWDNVNLTVEPTLVSEPVHTIVEPTVAAVVDPLTSLLGIPVSPIVHQVNCDVVEPVEDVVDSVAIPLVTETKVALSGLLFGLLG